MAPADLAPTYRFENGRIISIRGHILTPVQARQRMDMLLADMADVEARYGDNQPETADLLHDLNLRSLRQLRAAIAQARSDRAIQNQQEIAA